jgi:hypothetical protein
MGILGGRERHLLLWTKNPHFWYSNELNQLRPSQFMVASRVAVDSFAQCILAQSEILYRSPIPTR